MNDTRPWLVRPTQWIRSAGRRWPWLLPGSLVVAGVGFGLLAEHEQQMQSGRPTSWVWPDLVGGWVFLAAGLLVWRHRPSNRCWWLLMAAGVTWFVGTFAAAAGENVSLAGFAFAGWSDVFLVWLLLAFPTGRLPGRRERLLLGAVVALFTVRTLARLFLFVPPDGTGCGCAPNRFLPLTDPRWYDAVDRAFPWAFTGAFALVLAATVARWRRSSRPGRRMLAPALASAALVSAELAYTYVLRRQVGLTVPTPTGLFYVIVAARVVTAAAFVVGLQQLRSARFAVVDLVGGLPERDPAPDRLADALRRALGDPSLELVPWSPKDGAYVDAAGRALSLPVAASGRAATVIEQDGRPVAALVHDEALLEDPGLVSAVVAAVRLTADNERLRRALQRQLDEVAASRARIVAAGDAERRRIERDLHDGAQQRLVTIALSLRLAEARLTPAADPATRQALAQAVKELGGAVDELRDLARGIHPSVLTESGLGVALESLVDRSPLPVRLDVRLPDEPSTPAATAAYFAVAEALTNAAKHARARAVTLLVTAEDGWLSLVVADDGVGGAQTSAGSGLAGLADRVAAGGGTLRVHSPPGGGTRVEVRLPCG